VSCAASLPHAKDAPHQAHNISMLGPVGAAFELQQRAAKDFILDAARQSLDGLTLVGRERAQAAGKTLELRFANAVQVLFDGNDGGGELARRKPPLQPD